MARMAWISEGSVINIIQINPEQIPEFECEGVQIVDFAPLDVQIRDEYRDGLFYRDGVRLEDQEDPPLVVVPTEGLSEDAIAALELMGVQVYE